VYEQLFGDQQDGRKKRILRDEEDGSTMHVYIWDSMMKPIKRWKGGRGQGEREWEYPGGGELVQGTLFADIELLQ
jgi:hypothetical protein